MALRQRSKRVLQIRKQFNAVQLFIVLPPYLELHFAGYTYLGEFKRYVAQHSLLIHAPECQRAFLSCREIGFTCVKDVMLKITSA